MKSESELSLHSGENSASMKKEGTASQPQQGMPNRETTKAIAPQNGNPQNAARPHPPNIAPGKRSAAAAHAPGPHPLTPDETVEFVKALRKRLRKNGRKIRWQNEENLGPVVFLITVVLCFSIFIITNLDVHNTADEDERYADPEDEAKDNEPDTADRIVYAVTLIFLLFLCGCFSLNDPYCITGHGKASDIDFLYPGLLNRGAIVELNFRVALGRAALLNIGVFFALIWFLHSDPFYFRALLAFCVYSFAMNFILVVLNTYSGNRFRREKDGMVNCTRDDIKECDTGKWHLNADRIVKGSLCFFILYPFILLALMYCPLLGIPLLLANYPVYRFWKRVVLPSSIYGWHLDEHISRENDEHNFRKKAEHTSRESDEHTSRNKGEGQSPERSGNSLQKTEGRETGSVERPFSPFRRVRQCPHAEDENGLGYEALVGKPELFKNDVFGVYFPPVHAGEFERVYLLPIPARSMIIRPFKALLFCYAVIVTIVLGFTSLSCFILEGNPQPRIHLGFLLIGIPFGALLIAHYLAFLVFNGKSRMQFGGHISRFPDRAIAPNYLASLFIGIGAPILLAAFLISFCFAISNEAGMITLFFLFPAFLVSFARFYLRKAITLYDTI